MHFMDMCNKVDFYKEFLFRCHFYLSFYEKGIPTKYNDIYWILLMVNNRSHLFVATINISSTHKKSNTYKRSAISLPLKKLISIFINLLIIIKR